MTQNGGSGKEALLLSTTSPNPRRGEVWNVNFDPTVGAEIKKIRPAVVISIDNVGRLPIKIVAPITIWKPEFSGRIWLVPVNPNRTNGLRQESAVDILQIKSVDVKRFRKKRGRLTATLMTEIGEAITAIIDHQ